VYPFVMLHARRLVDRPRRDEQDILGARAPRMGYHRLQVVCELFQRHMLPRTAVDRRCRH